MADPQTTVAELTKLNGISLPEDWVKVIWEKDFTDVEPLPLDVEERLQNLDYHVENLKNVRLPLSPWATGKEASSGEGFWTVLVENDLSHKTFIALLYYLMEVGKKRLSNPVQKEAGILAADLYMLFVSIPGSGAFKVFHPMLFEIALDMLKQWSLTDGQARKRKASSGKTNLSQNSKKGNKSKRSKNKESIESNNPFEEDEEEEEEESVLSPQEVKRLQKALQILLRDFVSLLSNYSLKDNTDSVRHGIQILAELTRFESETFEGNFDENRTIERIHNVPELAYKGLNLITSASHGDVFVNTRMVFQHLLPNILMLIGDRKAIAAQTIPRNIQDIKDHAVSFMCHLIKNNSGDILPSVRTLIQHLCVKVPDKTEYRGKVAQSIIAIMKLLSLETYAKTMEWLHKFSRNSKIAYRVFALDLVSLMLAEPERECDGSESAEVAPLVSHKFLIQMLLSRCSDIAPTVRAKAITGFSLCSVSTDEKIKKAIKDMVTPCQANRPPMSRLIPTPVSQRTGIANIDVTDSTNSEGNKDNSEMTDSTNSVGNKENSEMTDNQQSRDPLLVNDKTTEADITPSMSMGSKVSLDSNRISCMTVALTPGNGVSLYDGKGVLSMLRRRARDDKINVRKSSLSAIENIIRMDKDGFDKEDLDILRERCQDVSLSVRKQAMLSLTDLLTSIPNNHLLQHVWLDGVLPMVMDRESTCQDKCFEALEEVLLSNIGPYHRMKDDHQKLVWSLLDILAGNKGVELRHFIQAACQQWNRQKKIKPTLITSLQSHVGTENNAGVWLLLAEISCSAATKFPMKFVVDYWHNHAKSAQAKDFETVQRVLKVLGHMAKHVAEDDVNDLSLDLRKRLMQFDSPPELVTMTVNTLNKLCIAQTPDRDAAKQMTDVWFEELLKECDLYLSKVILNEDMDEHMDEEKIVKHLFTLGELAQICPEKTPKRVFMLVQSLIASPVITTIDGSTQQPSCRQSTQSTQSQQTQQLTQFKGSKMSGKVRAHAFITLGKLCLQNEDIAKKCVAAIARELEISTDPAVRNNVVVVLCDLCIRYTTLVDQYVPNIAACLKDSSGLIRKQTLTLLTNLLQEDFLKWRGALFYRFITSLVDDDQDIANFAKFCLIHILLKRHPDTFFHHFVECVYHFNAYENHTVYNKFTQTERERTMFSLKGKANAKKRMVMYTFMLENMNDIHRFQITAKLASDVLAAVVDDILPLDADTSCLLQDALAILCCKEIKLSTMKTRSQDDVAETEQDMAQAVMIAAKKTLITQVVKKNVIENIVPIVTSLKHILEQNRSPVIKDLMMYLRELMKDYKDEIKDILAADKRLATEIEFDLRKFEEQQELERQKAEERRNRSNLLSPQAMTPSPGSSPARQPLSPRVNATPGRNPGTPRIQRQNGGISSPGINPPSMSPSNRSGVRTPKAKTPKRPIPISTLAIINSARKAVAEAKRLSDVKNISEDSSKNLSKSKKKVGWADIDVEGDLNSSQGEGSAEASGSGFKTPKSKRIYQKTPRKSCLRAISTPSGNTTMVGNLTFHQDHNISMIPPSPIPSSLPIRMYPDSRHSGEVPGTPSWTAQEEGSKQKDKDLIVMFSPEHPAPRPRKWNVRASQSDVETINKKDTSSKKHGRGGTSPRPEAIPMDPLASFDESPPADAKKTSNRNKMRNGHDTSEDEVSIRQSRGRKASHKSTNKEIEKEALQRRSHGEIIPLDPLASFGESLPSDASKFSKTKSTPDPKASKKSKASQKNVDHATEKEVLQRDILETFEEESPEKSVHNTRSKPTKSKVASNKTKKDAAATRPRTRHSLSSDSSHTATPDAVDKKKKRRPKRSLNLDSSVNESPQIKSSHPRKRRTVANEPMSSDGETSSIRHRTRLSTAFDESTDEDRKEGRRTRRSVTKEDPIVTEKTETKSKSKKRTTRKK